MVGDDKTNDDKPKDTCDMKASDVSSPYYLHPSDHPGIKICQVVLKCENFQEWERCMRNAFRAKRKLEWSKYSTYYGKLKKLWDELSMYVSTKGCTCGKCKCNWAAELSKERDERQVYQFLMGLDDNLYGNIYDYSQGILVYLMGAKSEVGKIIRIFLPWPQLSSIRRLDVSLVIMKRDLLVWKSSFKNKELSSRVLVLLRPGSDIVNDTNDVRYATNKSQENTGGHRRSSRERQPSVLLRHFVCHTIQSLDPIQSCAPPNDSSSSGTRYHLANFVTYNKFSTAHTQFLAAVTMCNEPTRFSQAITDPNWRDAMHKEIDALEKNGTWVLEDLPHGKKAIGCKWVYKIKYHSDGTIERYKARLVILGNNQWELHQMDVHNAFLHGDLDEEVYMKLPPGFYGSRGKVCRLKNGIELHVLVYVDDLIVAGNNSDAIAKFRAYMSTCFHMKDLGALKYFLGIEIARHPEGIFLSQRKYALDILSESDLLGAKPCDFPIEPNHQLALASGPDFNQPDRYRCLVGRLFYLTFTRPELCYSIHTLAQFMQSPKDTDICLIERFEKTKRSKNDQKPYFIMLGMSPISWKTKKQPTVSRSFAEAEYRSTATTSCELTWLKSLFFSLGVHGSRPMHLFCDNIAVIHIASNPVFHDRTKHIEVDCHYVREQIQAGNIVTSHDSTNEQPVDILTKALGKRPFQYLLRKLGVRDLHAPT
ncbi:retrovirus-related pol polyprotein from transposon RE2 [Tanacetum coccineum]